MSYTIKIKEEISNIKSLRSELISELSGYIRNNSVLKDKKIIMTTENKCVVDRIVNSIKDIYNIEPKVSIVENLNFSKKDLFQIIISENTEHILKDMGYLDKDNNYLEKPPTYIIDADEEVKGYLRGVFLAIGSINDPKTSRYHMELLVSKAQESIFIQRLLNDFELNAKILNRDKGYMIYIKEAEKISDFLKILGANNAVLYYENIRVYKDKKNRTNRLNNCEQANMDKVIQTATLQLEEIKIIEENDGVVLLDDKVKEVLNYRKKYPEASLKELAEIISVETNKPITKSGLNHRLRKIKELAKRIEQSLKKNESINSCDNKK